MLKLEYRQGNTKKGLPKGQHPFEEGARQII